MRALGGLLGEELPEFGVERPETILQWSRETFGERTPLQIMTRASNETQELMTAVLNGGELSAILEELSDSAIMLWQVAALLIVPPRPALGAQAYLPPANLAIKLQRRALTVVEELHWGSPEATSVAATVLHDALGLLEALVRHYGGELPEMVDAKMVINRARAWTQRADGSYQHVAAAPAVAVSVAAL